MNGDDTRISKVPPEHVNETKKNNNQKTLSYSLERSNKNQSCPNELLETEALLLAKVKDCDENIKELKRQLENFNSKTYSYKKFEGSSCYKKSSMNILNISKIELKGFFPSDLRENINLCVIIKLGEQEYITKSISNTLDPTWEQEFSVDISCEITKVVFEIFDLASKSFQAYGEFSLRTIRNQLYHNLWLDLRNAQNKKIPGNMRVSVQWIYSEGKKRLFKQILVKISAQQHLKEQLLNALSALRKPCEHIKALDRPSFELFAEKSTHNLTDFIRTPQIFAFRPLNKFFIFDNMLWVIYILLSVIINQSRTDIFNITVSVLGMGTNSLSISQEPDRIIRLGLFALTCSILFDLSWTFTVGGFVTNFRNILIWGSVGIKLLIFGRLKRKLLYVNILSLVEKEEYRKLAQEEIDIDIDD